MPTSTRVLLVSPAVLAGAAGLCLTASTALAQEGSEITSAESGAVEAEAGPQDTPGKVDGPRTRPPETPAETAKPEEPPEWFGGKSYWEWSRMTGTWGGLRTRLEDNGLTIAASYALDWSSVWSGGVRNVASTRSLLDVNATLDLEKAFKLTGGTLYADFYSSDTRGGSRDVGDVMGIDSNETGDNVDELAEVWYEQKLFDNALRVKIGKIDVNSEFNSTLSNPYHMHATAAVNATMVSMPTYPDPALGVAVFWYPIEELYIGGGVFDGSLAKTKHTGRHAFQDLGRGDEVYYIGEVGYSWKSLLGMGHGRVAGGGWLNTSTYNRFDGGTEDNTAGGYVVFEQQILTRSQMPDDDTKGLFFFARYGFADEALAAVGNHFAAGLSLNGTFNGRDDDAAGFMVSYADLSDDALSGFVEDETAIELFYRWQITPFLALTPDIQFILNPGGTGALSDAVVGALRLELSF